MGKDRPNENKSATPTPPAGEINKGCGGRRGGHNRQRWNNNVAIGSAGKFKGKTPGIEHDIFDNTGVHDAANFHRSLKHIADHLSNSNHDTSRHHYTTCPKRNAGSKRFHG